MNRKFVKENKQALKEFFIDMLSNFVSKRAIGNMDKLIDADPALKKRKDDIIRMSNDMRKRIAKVKKEDPTLYRKLMKNPLLKKYA
tara:strand:+ start:910 stop:1167 length:258 start_codon:yes stop_codon:yes gene_type:complete